MALSIVFVLSPITTASGQKSSKSYDLKHWPAGCSPQEVGKHVAEHFAASPHFNYFRPKPPRSIIYPETCTWWGTLTFVKLTNDKQLADKLTARFDPLFGADSSLIPAPNHVDNTIFGAVPLELFILTKDVRYLRIGKHLADAQWTAPSGNWLQVED